MADYNLGTARGRVEIDGSGVQRGLSGANNELERMQNNATNASTAMLGTGASLLTASATITGGLFAAVNAAADFEERLSAVQAVSGATADEMELLSELALRLGADTAFSATEAASAIEELVKAGLSVEDTLNGAADATVNLAAAGEVDLVTAATMASNAMNAFNLAAEDMPRVADLIAGAANASAIDVGEFGMAMQQSAAVANLAGLSFDDLSLAIAAMGNAGIRGSDAGTSLKTFLQNLQPVTDKQIELFQELGLTLEDGTNAFYNMDGSIKSMTEISEVLGGALEGMTDQQKQMALETLFGSDAIRAAAVIADTGADGFNELADAMNAVSAQDVAETRMDNLRGSLEELSGSFETLMIRIGTPLLGSIRGVVDNVNVLVDTIANLDEGVLGLITTIARMTASFTGVAGGLLVAYGAFLKLRAGIGALSLIMKANPLFAFITVVLALGAALYQLYQGNETFRNAVNQLFAEIRSTVLPIIDTLVTGFRAMISAFQDGDVTSDGIIGVFERIGATARVVFDNVSSFIRDVLVPALQDFADFVMNDVLPAIMDIGDFFMDEVVPVIQDVGEWFAWLGSEILERLESAFNWLRDHVWPVLTATGELVAAFAAHVDRLFSGIATAAGSMGPVWQAVWWVISTVLGNIRTAIEIAVNIIMAIWRNFGDNIFRVIDFAWDTIVGIVENVLRVIQGIIQVATGIISGDWRKAWEGIRNIFGGVWDFISGLPGTILEGIKIVIQNALDFIGTIWDVAWETAKSLLSRAWEVMASVVGQQVGAIVEWVRGLPGRAVDALSSLAGRLSTVAQQALSRGRGFLQGFINAWADISEWVRNIPRNIMNALGNLRDILLNAGREIMNGLWDGLREIWERVKGWFQSLTGWIPDWKGPPDRDKVLLTENGRLIMEGFLRGLQDRLPEVMQFLDNVAPAIQATIDTGGTYRMASTLTPAVNGGGDETNVTLEFHGPYGPDFENEIRSTLSDPGVISEVVAAVRAGRRG